MRKLILGLCLLMVSLSAMGQPFPEDDNEPEPTPVPYGINHMVIVTVCDEILMFTLDVNYGPPELIGQTLSYAGDPSITDMDAHKQDIKETAVRLIYLSNADVTFVAVDEAGAWRCA